METWIRCWTVSERINFFIGVYQCTPILANIYFCFSGIHYIEVSFKTFGHDAYQKLKLTKVKL